LIIRDKRYTINNLKSNITTGEVELELLHDLREIGNSNPPILDNGAGSIDIPVLLLNGATQTAVSTSTLGVTFSAVTFTSDDYVTVTYPANPTAEFEIITEDEAGDNVITSDNFNLIDEESNYTIIPIQFVHTLQNGDNLVNYTYILQEP
jgi:predicted secreted protein